MNQAVYICISIFALLMSSLSHAEWELAKEGTSLYFVSTKNNTVSEIHEFTGLDGSLSADGRFNITIDTRNVETGVPIRNQRMNKILFESGLYPFIAVSGKVNFFNADEMKAGALREGNLEVELTISMRGISLSLIHI